MKFVGEGGEVYRDAPPVGHSPHCPHAQGKEVDETVDFISVDTILVYNVPVDNYSCRQLFLSTIIPVNNISVYNIPFD